MISPFLASAIYRSGRSDPDVLKFIFLCTALDPPEWDRTLEISRNAKDLGIQILASARGEDKVNKENFQKLSSGRLMFFAEEREHLRIVHNLIDSGRLCKAATPTKKVNVKLQIVENNG